MVVQPKIGMSDDDIRPDRFSHIIGNAPAVTRITNCLASGYIPRLFYFNGATGVGKNTLARITARSILCENRPLGSFEPCGECQSCRVILGEGLGSHYAYEEWGAGSLDLVDLEDLKHSTANSWTVTFIDELQDISQRKVMRLRPMIEQTKGVLMFATMDPDRIEHAISSRLCSYEYKMTRPKTPEVVAYFKRRFQEWGIFYQSEEQLVRVANTLRNEMRPCGEFPRKVLAEANGQLTDAYLEAVYGADLAPLNDTTAATWDPNPEL